jgi:hypothetical protein
LNEYLEWILQEYSHTGIIVDTNILLLLVVGLNDRTRVGRTRRTEAYVVEDFDLAFAFVQYFDRILTHSSILAETSNLVGQAAGNEAIALRVTLAHQIPHFTEYAITAAMIASDPQFIRLGFTDTAISRLAASGAAVLTDDLPLYHRLIQSGAPAVNFNHLREGNLLG